MTVRNLWKALWKDEKSNLVNPEAFSKIAEKWAKEVSEEGMERGRAKRNKATQIRKYYDELFKLNQRARMQGSEWEAILPHVHMLIAKAAYAKGRDLVTDSFVDGLRDMISGVQTREHLQAVTSFMEAFMAFYKLYRPRD